MGLASRVLRLAPHVASFLLASGSPASLDARGATPGRISSLEAAKRGLGFPATRSPEQKLGPSESDGVIRRIQRNRSGKIGSGPCEVAETPAGDPALGYRIGPQRPQPDGLAEIVLGPPQAFSLHRPPVFGHGDPCLPAAPMSCC